MKQEIFNTNQLLQETYPYWGQPYYPGRLFGPTKEGRWGFYHAFGCVGLGREWIINGRAVYGED